MIEPWANRIAHQEGSGAKTIADHTDHHDRYDCRHFMGEADCRHWAANSA